MVYLNFYQTQSQPIYVQKGHRSSQVVEVQSRLTRWGCYKGPLDGIFGAEVEAGVLRFQFQYFLEEDGIVGPKTWRVLQTGIPLNMPILSLGSWGKQVIIIQEILTITNHYSQSITGQFDATTNEAVKRFQKSWGLTVDGIVGQQTCTAFCQVPRSYPPVK